MALIRSGGLVVCLGCRGDPSLRVGIRKCIETKMDLMVLEFLVQGWNGMVVQICIDLGFELVVCGAASGGTQHFFDKKSGKIYK